MHRTRNAAYGQPYRGFKSLPLRHSQFTRRRTAVTATILIALAGLIGAAGIALAAAGAHAAPGAGLDGAAYMLLFHAAAVLGGTALVQQGAVWRPLALVVLAAWIVGATLFSGDIALRT